MKFDIESYVRVYKDIFDPSFCEQTIKSLENEAWEKHQFYNCKENRFIQYENELSICRSNSQEKETIQNRLWHLIERYICTDIQPNAYKGWNGYSSVRFNKYEVGTEMHEHCDHIHSLFEGQHKGVPVLSIVGLLNDDYEGGQFLMWGGKVIDLPIGSVVIFPSNFMYPHRVSLITKGVRHSFVSWVW